MEDTKQKEMQETINEMSQLAMKLHSLMSPGMTISIAIPQQKAIIVPGRKEGISYLFVTRPDVTLSIRVAPVEPK
jgi:hypothetical protein